MSGPSRTLSALVNAGVTHVLGIPDNTSGPLFDEVRRHPTIRIVTVTREGEAMAMAAGLWLGGAKPLVVIQNTGLLESGDALRGTLVRMAAPVALVVTGRGYAKMRAAGATPGDARTIESLTRPEVDSTALVTEPTLDAWGIPYRVCDDGDDPASMIPAVLADAEAQGRPTALVLTRSLD